ncbi:hypothetical protein Desaci_4071 [Desulfosporosinus acidiphilus SJ4]|uniref:Uncharacterized protein n=1 Tax=Desulfosporosinus acidiphilus (strain DSM 22704 / JCM 16185 / SJ4) TaxID=646529 RepID=I4DAW0_DESAJ|nr:hypothetical protein [Desulfosporosinus acidiphilus]AFM42934.1 hypothetical protein Desaci_4071 [Desulfosporosinus acidiphilus SJ4]
MSDERQGICDAIHTGTKGIISLFPGTNPDKLFFLMAIWLKERGYHSNENILLEKAKNVFDWIIVTDNYSKDRTARISKLLKAPFALQY